MKLNWKREMFPLTVLAAMAVVGTCYYPILPGIVPSHFNLQGRPDGWMPKPAYYLLTGGMSVAVYLLLTFLAKVDPLKKKIESKFGVVLLIRDVLLVFFAVLFFLGLDAAKEGAMHVRFLGIALGLLFVVLGNYMPKVPQNWFLGIRTPWTISSEVIWKKTHILGGWLFTLAGLLFVISDSFRMNDIIPFIGIMAAGGLSSIYSFYLYKTNKEGRAES